MGYTSGNADGVAETVIGTAIFQSPITWTKEVFHNPGIIFRQGH